MRVDSSKKIPFEIKLHLPISLMLLDIVANFLRIAELLCIHTKMEKKSIIWKRREEKCHWFAFSAASCFFISSIILFLLQNMRKINNLKKNRGKYTCKKVVIVPGCLFKIPWFFPSKKQCQKRREFLIEQNILDFLKEIRNVLQGQTFLQY